MRKIAYGFVSALALVACGGGGNTDDGGGGMDSVVPMGDVFVIEEDGAVTRPDIQTPPADGSVSVVRGAWRVVPSGTVEDIRTVWGTAANNVWAANARGRAHYNGTRWSPTPADYIVFAVHGSAQNDVWQLGMTIPPNGSGETGRPVFERSTNGTSFTQVTNSMLVGPFNQLFAVSPMFVWTVGTGLPARWDGARWVPAGMGVPPMAFVSGVWASAPNDAVAVGTTVLRWNGTTWMPQTLEGDAFIGVGGLNANDVWVVGATGVIWHWTGTWNYSEAGMAFDLIRFTAVWAAASNDVWVVGERGTIIHYNGMAWTQVPSMATQTLLGIWGSSPNDIWAVGEMGTLLHYTVP